MQKEYEFRMRMTSNQYYEIKNYFDKLPAEIILEGLKFANNRYDALRGKYLLPGRKSIIKKETNLMTKEQARWRLENWKTIIKTYRDKGYSYPTISRIKKEILKVSKD